MRLLTMSVIGSNALRFGGFARRPTRPLDAPDDAQCAVCLNDVTDQEWADAVVEWPACGHFGHRACLQYSAMCPTCRAPLGRPSIPLPVPAPSVPFQAAATAVTDSAPTVHTVRTALVDAIRRNVAGGTYEANRPQFEYMIDQLRQMGTRISSRQLGLPP